MCANGCIHGVTIQVLNKTNDVNEVIKACELTKDVFIKNQCYHGIGHAAVKVYGENFEKTLDICRKTGDKTWMCTDGIAHQALLQKWQNFTSPTLLIQTCKDIPDERAREHCYLAVGFFLPLHRNQDYSQAAQECFSIQYEDAKKFCIMGIGVIISTNEYLNLTSSNEICKNISLSYLEQCINGIFFGMFYFGNITLTQCKYFEEPFREKCINTIEIFTSQYGSSG